MTTAKSILRWLFRNPITTDPEEIRQRQRSLANAMLCFMI